MNTMAVNMFELTTLDGYNTKDYENTHIAEYQMMERVYQRAGDGRERKERTSLLSRLSNRRNTKKIAVA